ncbi:MAG TPA: Gfo/Idh/MocA family oxidoreductase [Thermoguttaceae bacterium]|nr:Gfo/Idh/MocA family oxidoreductase [Thermoguttaceae bacterium]
MATGNRTQRAERRIRVGLVGLGPAWEQRRRPAIQALADRFEVRAVCEQVRHRAEQAAAQLGAEVVDGFRSLIAREDVEAVLLLAAQWYGPLPILAACEMGKAVYCGAGLELELEQARIIKQRVQQAGIPLMVELPRRHAPATLRLKELMATRLGGPRLLFCYLRAPWSEHPGSEGFHCGSTGDDLVELVDWCCYLVGQEPTYVTGLTHFGFSADEEADYTMISLDFSPPDQAGVGPLAQISCGRYIPSGWEEAITYRPLAALQIACQQGIAFVDLPSRVVWFDEAGRHLESLETERPVGERLLHQFYRLLTTPGCKSSDLDDAYRAMYIVHQARRSHHLGRRIRLDWEKAEVGWDSEPEDSGPSA